MNNFVKYSAKTKMVRFEQTKLICKLQKQIYNNLEI